MGFLSYHRAGAAKRQTRTAIRASRRLSSGLREVQVENDELTAIVEQQAALIERLQEEIDELRARLDGCR